MYPEDEESKTIALQSTDNETASNPTENQEPQNSYQQNTTQNDDVNQQNMNQNYNAYQQNTNQNYNAYQQNANQNYNAYQQNVNQNYNAYQQNANQNYNAYQQNANQNYNAYQQNANQNYNAYQQNTNQNYNAYQQNTNQNYNAYQQNASQNYNAYQQNANQNYNAYQQNANQNYNAYQQNANPNYNAYQQNAAQGNSQGYQQAYQQNPNQSYVQQNAYQQNSQNPYYVNQPGMNPNPMNTGKKKSKLKIILPLAALLVVVIVGGVLFFVLRNQNKSSEDAVVTAINRTFSSESPTAVSGYLGTNELSAASDAYESSFSFNITNLDGYSMPYEASYLEGLGISVSAALDMDNELYSASGSINYGGISYIDYTVYAYDDCIALSCPSLFDGYVYIETAHLGSDFNSSMLAELTDMTLDSGLTFNFFDYMRNANASVAMPEGFNEFLDNIEYEKADSQSITINGKSENCQGYHVIITTESMEALAKWFCDYMATSSPYASYSSPYTFASTLSYSDVKEMLPEDDIVFTVYVDKKGRMVQLSLDTDITIYGETATFKGDISFVGGDNPTDNITGSIDMIQDGITMVSFTIDSLTNTSGTTTTTDTTLSAKMTGMTIGSINYNSSFDTSSGRYYLSMDIGSFYETYLKLTLDGVFYDVVAGTSYSFDFNDLTVNLMDGECIVSMNGSMSYGPLSGSIQKPSGNAYNLLQMNESDYEALIDEMGNHVLNGPLGSLIGDLSGMYDDDYYYDDYYDYYEW